MNAGETAQARARAKAPMMFVEDFDAPEAAPADPDENAEPEIIAPLLSEDDIAQARERGYAEGMAAGRAAAIGAREVALDGAVAAIRTALAEARTAAIGRADALAQAQAAMLTASLAVVLPDLVRRHGAAEITRLIREILPPMALEPEIAIHVAPGSAAAVTAELARLDPLLAGRVRIEPESGMAASDVTITWKEGRLVRDGAALRRRLDEVWQRFGLAMDIPAGEEMADAE